MKCYALAQGIHGQEKAAFNLWESSKPKSN